MNKILLFGAFGQLGRAWQTYFDELNSTEFCLNSYGSSDLDITRYNLVEEEVRKHQPDIIINCAAYTNVDQAEAERGKARRVNSKAVENLAQCCRKYDVKLVHFSTDYVFAGARGDRNRFPKGYREDHPADPVNWYGQTKWEGEQAVRNSSCRHLLIRVSWLCGLHGNNFVKTMLNLAESHSTLNVIDDQVGSPAFAGSLVKKTGLLIEKGCEGTYHCATNGILSWADFAEAIFECADKDVLVRRIASKDYPTEADRPFYSKLDTRKIEQIEGIKMEGWETELARLIEKLPD